MSANKKTILIEGKETKIEDLASLLEVSHVILVEGRDFTTKSLASFLNEKHDGKKTGKDFTSGDIQQYYLKGKLPLEYGGHPIEIIENETVGCKFLRVDFTKGPEEKLEE